MRGCLFALIVTVLLAARPPAAFAAVPEWCSGARCGGADGAWWQRLPRATRVPVVAGMISSYESAWDLGQFFEYSSYLSVYGNDADQKRIRAFVKRWQQKRNGPPVFSKSTAAYVAAIDRFYARYPSKLQLDVSEVLRCLRNGAQISCDTVGRSVVLPWPTGP